LHKRQFKEGKKNANAIFDANFTEQKFHLILRVNFVSLFFEQVVHADANESFIFDGLASL
jgi:hypothetical protein